MRLPLPGNDLPGVLLNTDFLRAVSLGEPVRRSGGGWSFSVGEMSPSTARGPLGDSGPTPSTSPAWRPGAHAGRPAEEIDGGGRGRHHNPPGPNL